MSKDGSLGTPALLTALAHDVCLPWFLMLRGADEGQVEETQGVGESEG